MVIFVGSVRNENTISGRAAIRTSRSSMSGLSTLIRAYLLFERLGAPLHIVKAGIPEAGQERPQRDETVRTRSIETPRPVLPQGHQPGRDQYLEMLRDGRLSHVEM